MPANKLSLRQVPDSCRSLTEAMMTSKRGFPNETHPPQDSATRTTPQRSHHDESLQATTLHSDNYQATRPPLRHIPHFHVRVCTPLHELDITNKKPAGG